jgi:hypothetical protein
MRKKTKNYRINDLGIGNINRLESKWVTSYNGSDELADYGVG